MSGREALAPFLLGLGAPPPIEALRAARLAAYAYTALPEGHPDRAACRPAYLSALARHHAIRREVLPLLRAWAAAGIETLLFKGFHLAEFVYPVPGTRVHADVDVLIRPEREGEALRIATALGWERGVGGSDYGIAHDHCAFTLFSPGGNSYLDVHRSIVHSYTSWSRVPARITRSVWEASRERAWEGITVRELQPVDALLAALILQRCWGDQWCLKAHDPLDFRLLAERGGVSREQLRARASALGCRRTVDLYLERCDPWEGRLELTRPSPRERWRLDAAVASERVPLRAEMAVYKLRLLRVLPADMLRQLPLLLRVRGGLRRTKDITALLRSLTPPAAGEAAGTLSQRVRLVRGIVWLTRLLPVNPKGDCLLRSLAIYAALRRRGWPAVLVTGLRREPTGVVGHAWVELDGRILAELKEPENRERYQESFRYPPQRERERVRGEAEYAPAGAGAAPPG